MRCRTTSVGFVDWCCQALTAGLEPAVNGDSVRIARLISVTGLIFIKLPGAAFRYLLPFFPFVFLSGFAHIK